MSGFDPSQPRDENGQWIGPKGPKRRPLKERIKQATIEKSIRNIEAAAAAGGLYLAYHRHKAKIDQAKNIAMAVHQYRKGF
jgi:hypothetical protein